MVNDKFIKNWLGIKLSDDEMRQIPYPKLETGLHVGLKGLQSGSIIGYFGSRLLFGIQRSFFKKESLINLTARQMMEKSCKISRNFMFIGVAVCVPMFFLHGMQNEVVDEGYYDRAYRIRYNVNQLNVDRMSLAFATVYGTIFTFTSKSFLLGFPKGLCWGTILAAAYNNYIEAEKLKQAIEEAKALQEKL